MIVAASAQAVVAIVAIETTMNQAVAASPPVALPHRVRKSVSQWEFWGRLFVVPYLLVFVILVLFPVGYGLWLARNPESYVKLFADPIFFRSVVNTVIFLVVAINLKMAIALFLSGFFVQTRWWIKILSVLFILPWAVPSIPTILSVRFMLNPEWGVINQTIFKLTGLDGPNWLNDPTLALSFSMLMHIWKSLPFWTLILVAGRLAIPGEQYEAAAVDGASSWQKFRYITWPSMKTLYVTSLILSMIWTLGDFNSVYLLTTKIKFGSILYIIGLEIFQYCFFECRNGFQFHIFRNYFIN